MWWEERWRVNGGCSIGASTAFQAIIRKHQLVAVERYPLHFFCLGTRTQRLSTSQLGTHIEGTVMLKPWGHRYISQRKEDQVRGVRYCREDGGTHGGLVTSTPIRRTVFLSLMILLRSDRWALMFYSVS